MKNDDQIKQSKSSRPDNLLFIQTTTINLIKNNFEPSQAKALLMMLDLQKRITTNQIKHSDRFLIKLIKRYLNKRNIKIGKYFFYLAMILLLLTLGLKFID